MNTKSFSAIFTVLHAFIIGVLVVTFFETVKQDESVIDGPARVFGCITVGAIAALLAYMTRFIYELIVLQQSHYRLVLTLNGQSSYETFYQPILEEVVKIAVVTLFQQTKCHRALNPFEMSLMWCGFILPSMAIYSYNPRGYAQKYAKFLAYYQSWLIQLRGEVPRSSEETRRFSKVWSNLVCENMELQMHDKERRRSTISSDKSHRSDHRLNAKISSKMLPNEFNLRDGVGRNNSSSTAAHGIDIPCPVEEGIVSGDELHSKTIQRMYSVSPKDTYHLIQAVAIATFGDDEEDDEREEPTVCTDETGACPNSSRFLPEVEEVFENIDDSFDEGQSLVEENHAHYKQPMLGAHFQSAVLDCCVPNNSNGRGVPETSFDTPRRLYEVSLKHDAILFKQRTLKFINWWSWLCTVLLPIGETAPRLRSSTSSYLTPLISNTQFVDERFPLLKLKLSNYNMNGGRVQEDEYEREQYMIKDKSVARAYDFKVFLSYYFDISLSPLAQPFALDKWFMKYGQLLTDTSFIWIFLDELNSMVWQMFVFQMIALFLNDLLFGNMAAFVLPVVIIKLFRMNYLRSYEKRFDFRIIITTEFITCTVLYCGLLLYIINK